MATDDRGPFDSFDEVCTQTQGPPATRTGYEELSHRDLHDLRKQRGYARKGPKASPCTRLRKMDEVDTARGSPMKRGRIQKATVESGEPAVEERRVDKRYRRADAHLNFATDKEILKQHGQWWGKEMQFFWNAPSNLFDGAIDVVPTAEAADECYRIPGQELPPEAESVFAKDVLAAKSRG